MQLHSKIAGPWLYKMRYRHLVVAIFPAIFLTWYFVVQSWPQSSFSPETLAIVPTPTTQTPIPSTIPTPPEIPIEDHAYVFYATSNAYACSALVNFHRLRTVFFSKVPAIVLVGPKVSDATISVMVQNGLEVIRDQPPPLAVGGVGYYTDVLLKLRALRLHQIKPNLKRIQVLDSDQLILKDLDPLFGLPLVDIAAPLAYWLDGASVTTTLLVANLSDGLWAIVNEAIRNIRKDEYDMDLINRVLAKRLMILPGRFCTLNSHWEALDVPGWFGNSAQTTNATDDDLVELFKEVEILHYTASGKPWLVDLDELDRIKPHAHPLFREQFRLWKEVANGFCRFDYDRRLPKPVVAWPVGAKPQMDEPQVDESLIDESLVDESLMDEPLVDESLMDDVDVV